MSLDANALDALAAGGCQIPGCTHDTHTFFLAARCHMDAGVDVSYESGTAELKLCCHACQKPIARIKVQQSCD